jgi:hypothetical protein
MEATIRANLKVIQYALKNYANEHGGVYPPTEKIKGGGNPEDILLKKRYLHRYPPNPYRSMKKPMENALGKPHSCGDFVYRRSADKYDFFLGGLGLKPNSGVNHDGYIVKVKKNKATD